MEDFDDLLRSPDSNGALDLSHNAWAILDEVVWTWSDTLYVLNVSYNAIKHLSPKLGGLYNLVELNISSNKLETVTEEIGSCVHLQIVRVHSTMLLP